MGRGLSHETSDFPPKRWLYDIRSRMILCFTSAFALILAGIILVQLFGVPFTSYGGVWETYKSEAMHNMNVIADLKEARLQLWVSERRNDLQVLPQFDHCR